MCGRNISGAALTGLIDRVQEIALQAGADTINRSLGSGGCPDLELIRKPKVMETKRGHPGLRSSHILLSGLPLDMLFRLLYTYAVSLQRKYR
jgi:hypothetical protein